MTATARKITRCACSTFEFGTFDVNSDEDYGTDCVETTGRIFAMGHDAKLVGYMVRAELAGQEIRQGTHTFASAVQAAGSISSALATKAQAQLDAAKARLAKKASKEADKAAKKSAKKAAPAPAPTHRDATIKIGRWTYSAKINLADGKATYTNGKGVEMTADKFTEIA